MAENTDIKDIMPDNTDAPLADTAQSDTATDTVPQTEAAQPDEPAIQSKKEEKKAGAKSGGGMLRGKTIEEVIEREAQEAQVAQSSFSMAKTLGGVMLARFFHKHITLVLLIGFILIIYISLGYSCQKKLTEIEKVERELKQARYKATVCSSRLTEMSRESNIMQRLSQYGDSTLVIPKEPPYLISGKQ